MDQRFIENLQKLEFYPDGDHKRSVLLTSRINDPTLDSTELFALEEARRFKASAVYFRHFPDNRAAIPQIYLYDNTDLRLSDNELAEIHRDLWSNCRIPIFIEVRETEFAVFDARSPVKVLDDGKIETNSITGKIKLISEAVSLYSQTLFDTGVFWEMDLAKNHFQESTSAYRDLIENLKTIRSRFFAAESLPTETANKLLVYSILIKYLEERGNQGDRLFAHDFFQVFGAQDFCDVLRHRGKVVELFDVLSKHFNGKIFQWTDESERTALANADLSDLAEFLYGDIELRSGQVSFWSRYSFQHLPVELISTVYEELLNERDDAVYTPEFLVNTLIDQCLPEREVDRLDVKVIDVSCGSGIFLVSAFKRLVQRRRYRQFKENRQLASLSSVELLEIIKRNIFGLDIEEDALRLTVFSLCLALCDQLTPKEIWTELKFDDTFQTNFRSQNFFDYIDQNKSAAGSFDLVIGNPPFSELSILCEEQSYYYIDKKGKRITLGADISRKLSAPNNPFPRNQLALMFLDQSPLLLKQGGALCLIMPASPLLYNDSVQFRKSFFSTYCISQILDLTSLERCLFENASVPTAVVFLNKKIPGAENTLSHITIRRTRSVEEKQFFEIDKYDHHKVSQEKAATDGYIWKCNLLGGGRLASIVDHYRAYDSIGKYIKKKNWYSSEGYIVGADPRHRAKKADFITGHRSIPAEAISESKVDENQIFIENETLFTRTRKQELYKPPVLLIRETIGLERIPVYLSDQYLTFKHQVLGISAPNEDKSDLQRLGDAFEKNKALYKLLLAITSSRYLVGKATSILKKDIMNLPYSANDEELMLSSIEKVISDDVLTYYIDMLSRGSNADANSRTATEMDLIKYGDVFIRLLNSVYGRSSKSFYIAKIIRWQTFIVAQFDYAKSSQETEFETVESPPDSLSRLIEMKYGRSAYLIKILKLYERNKIYLVKPSTLRFWLPSIAVKDADSVFSDSLAAGY